MNATGAIQADEVGNFLLILSMLLVTACFANFAFTYEKSVLKIPSHRYLSHGATFVFMLLIALLLESIVLASQVLYPSFYLLILIFSLLLYIGVLLYDIWDFLRAAH